jgi:hypothetical protein
VTNGQRLEDRIPFGVMADKVMLYIFTGMLGVLTTLVGWLCLQTVSLKQDTTAIIERGKSVDQRILEHDNAIRELQASDKAQIGIVEDIRLKQARHGW